MSKTKPLQRYTGPRSAAARQTANMAKPLDELLSDVAALAGQAIGESGWRIHPELEEDPGNGRILLSITNAEGTRINLSFDNSSGARVIPEPGERPTKEQRNISALVSDFIWDRVAWEGPLPWQAEEDSDLEG